MKWLRRKPTIITAVCLVVVLTAALQLATVYAPPLNAIFKTEPLSAAELGVCMILSAVVFVAVEIEKSLARRGWLYQPRLPSVTTRHDSRAAI